LGGVTLTAHLTPGHTKGCTTWTTDVTDHGHVEHVVVSEREQVFHNELAKQQAVTKHAPI
jgi:hypothetical protein